MKMVDSLNRSERENEALRRSNDQREAIISNSVVLLVGVLTLGMSYLIRKESDWHWVPELFRDLGIAFIIGGCLSLTIERRSRQRMQAEVDLFIRRVSRNFIQAIYGTDLPPKLLDVVTKSIFEQRFVRNKYTVQIDLHDFKQTYVDSVPVAVKGLLQQFLNTSLTRLPLDYRSRLVVFKTMMSYEIQNVSELDLPHTFAFVLEKPFAGQFDELCGMTSIIIRDKDILGGSIYFQNANPSPDPTILRFERIEMIPAGESVFARFDGYSIRLNEETETWFLNMPTNGAHFIVTDHTGDKRINIDLRAFKLSHDNRNAEKDPNTNRAELKTDQFLLPFQGITVKWSTSVSPLTGERPIEDGQFAGQPS